MDKSDIPLIKFNGKNYTSWAFQFQIHLKSKEMWGHIDGFDLKPTPDPKPTNVKNDEKSVDRWKIKDAQILSWIVGTVES